MFEALLKALAARGHSVDVLSHFPQEQALPNYRDLSVSGALRDMNNNMTFDDALECRSTFASLSFFWVQNLAMCEEVYKHPVVQQLLQSDEHYDLVVTELFGVDCMLGFGHKFRAPVVNMLSTVLLPWANDRFGNPDNPAYVPVYFLPLTPPLGFVQRVANALALALLKAGSHLVGDRATEQMMRSHFGDDLPPLEELQRNVSLVLVNSHFSLHLPRPLVPALVEVAGLHIAPTRPLPPELQRFLDGAEHGVVYFSFGSLVRADTMPPRQLAAVLEELGALPQRVLWKADAALAALPRLPGNVLAMPWLPQADLLAHPKVRLFITHGGLMGTQEAVHHGVPMVVVPFFGDQIQNARNYVARGVAVSLSSDCTRQQFRDAVRQVLDDPGYRERAQELSRLFRDRPQPPLQTAVYWTEYVMRHRGAPHLRSPAVQLAWYELWLLDVAAALAALATLLAAALWLAARALAEWRGRLQDASRQPWISISNGKSKPRLNQSNGLNGYNEKEKVH